jgi:hypothetical protein
MTLFSLLWAIVCDQQSTTASTLSTISKRPDRQRCIHFFEVTEICEASAAFSGCYNRLAASSAPGRPGGFIGRPPYRCRMREQHAASRIGQACSQRAP